jgi:hypothetical protein
MIQLAWRFLRFQKNSALAQWYQARTADHRGAARPDCLGDFLDPLYRGRAGADDADPLTSEIDAFLGPGMRMAGLPLKRIDPGNVGHRRRGENADRRDQEPR